MQNSYKISWLPFLFSFLLWLANGHPGHLGCHKGSTIPDEARVMSQPILYHHPHPIELNRCRKTILKAVIANKTRNPVLQMKNLRASISSLAPGNERLRGFFLTCLGRRDIFFLSAKTQRQMCVAMTARGTGD